SHRRGVSAMNTTEMAVFVGLWLVLFSLALLVLLMYRQVEKAYSAGSFGRSAGLLPGVEFPGIEVIVAEGMTTLSFPTEGRIVVAFLSTTCDACRKLVDALVMEPRTNELL